MIDKLDLPPKFYFSGHSFGGALGMLYACNHPERLEGLFLQSSAGAEDETAEGWTYDPYTIRTSSDADIVPPKKKVDQ